MIRNIPSWDELPDILTAQNIADYLHISRRRIYELFQINETSGGIPNLDIGASKRVKKETFKRWLAAREQEKAEKVI